MLWDLGLKHPPPPIFPSDMDKKGFMDPIRTLTLAQLKQEHTDRSRTPTGKDAQLHRLYLEAQGKHARLAHTQVRRAIATTCMSVMAFKCVGVCWSTFLGYFN